MDASKNKPRGFRGFVFKLKRSAWVRSTLSGLVGTTLGIILTFGTKTCADNVAKERTAANASNTFYKLNPEVSDLPDALSTDSQEINETEINALKKAVDEAITRLEEFRIQEGAMLQHLFEEKIANIAQLLKEVEPYEKERIEKIKGRIIDALTKIDNFDYDKNRFEQEMIFYIEKLDINEEKHRLDNHLKYFLETMQAGKGQGKKLGFISQEMGREINTLGSKSNQAEMQRIVVRMKDELEQIKEQVLNVM